MFFLKIDFSALSELTQKSDDKDVILNPHGLRVTAIVEVQAGTKETQKSYK